MNKQTAPSTNKSLDGINALNALALPLGGDAIEKIINSLSDIVFICEKGLIKYANPHGLAVLGAKNEDDLTNYPFQSLIADDYASIVDDILSMLALEDKPTSMRVKCLDGRQLSIRMEVINISENGDDTAIVLGHDITQQVRLTEGLHRSETQFRKLVDSSLNFICVCDKDGVITYVNQSGVKILIRLLGP